MPGIAYTVQTDDSSQTPPQDNDVVAGWTAFALFIILIIAVALLSWSMVRHFRKVEANRKKGLFGEDAAREGEDDEASAEQTDKAPTPGEKD